MFDGAHRYESEYVSVPRTRTDDLTVQILVEGSHHRRTPDLQFTACGRYKLHSEFYPPRRETLTHPLSRDCGCFTAFELAEADRRHAEEYEDDK